MRAAVIAAILGSLAATALAQPAPDTARAKELYKSAEAAMEARDYPTAIRDYGGAYDITRDPVLFYKIGTANERAGKCPVAVIYYRRYIAEAKPTPAFVDITNARIKACEPAKSEPAKPEPAKPEPAKPEPAKPEPAKPEPAKPAPAKPEPAKPAPAKPEPSKPAGKPVATGEPTEPAKDDAKTAMGGFVGSREKPAPGTTALPAKNRAAWLFVTGSVALVTVGAVLAYSADSAENDVSDLYVGFGGNPPVFDRETKVIYDDLIAEGERYERLSWISFGLAGLTAGTAAVLFWREHRRGEHATTVTPTVSKDGAGVNATVRF